MTLAQFPQLQALSVREKLELVDELWREASQEAETLDATQEEKDLLDARWKDFLATPESALTVEQFKEQLTARRNERR
jgi:putative addiction module component (TIGR02574 family)